MSRRTTFIRSPLGKPNELWACTRPDILFVDTKPPVADERVVTQPEPDFLPLFVILLCIAIKMVLDNRIAIVVALSADKHSMLSSKLIKRLPPMAATIGGLVEASHWPATERDEEGQWIAQGGPSRYTIRPSLLVIRRDSSTPCDGPSRPRRNHGGPCTLSHRPASLPCCQRRAFPARRDNHIPAQG